MKRNRKLVLIVALIAAAVYYLLPSVDFYSMTDDEREAMELKSPEQLVDLKKRSLNLGLDLQGGIHLVLEVKTEGMEQQEAQDAVAQAQEVIRNRVDQFGVAEPTIQRQGDNRIIIELPGVQDVQRAKDLVGQTALLEFQLLEPSEDRTRLIQRIDQVLAPQEEEEEEEEDLLLSSTAENAPLSSMLSPAGEDLTVSGRDLQRVKNLLNTPEAQELIPADVEFLFSSKPAGAAGNEFYFLYLVRKKPEMTGHMIQDAFVSIGQVVEYMGQPIVNFSTTDEGVRLFSRITGSHIGERMAIVLDESVYSAPVIQNKISEGRGIITGSGTQEEAKDLSIVLRAGALPAEVEIIEDRTVGPSLGRDSIEQGKTAAIYSMILVVIFMVLYYRAAGLIADCALLLNMLFIMAVLAGFHATLTLPGIAGIILTIGMAVDANVLIFERIREELRSGKTVRAAIDSGYGHALSAIIDANVTTFLVGIVLYQFGTGPIRGFALTLCIGIISSLFTAFFVTRTIFELDHPEIGAIDLEHWANRAFLQPEHPLPLVAQHWFSAPRRPCCSSASSPFWAPIWAPMASGKGIDFAGGTLLELHFDPAVQVEDIRSQLGRVPCGRCRDRPEQERDQAVWVGKRHPHPRQRERGRH